MAYVVLAYVVMAYVGMAYMVMADIVMAITVLCATSIGDLPSFVTTSSEAPCFSSVLTASIMTGYCLVMAYIVMAITVLTASIMTGYC